MAARAMAEEHTQHVTPFDDFIDRLMRGEAEDPEEFLRAHPDLRDEEREQVRRMSGLFGGITDAEDATSVEEASGDRRLGPYRLIRQLGEGGMGVVWLAREDGLDREVAIKILRSELDRSAEATERLKREAAAAARVNHPCIVTVYGAGHEGNVRWLAMEHVEGVPLDGVIREARESGQPLVQDEVVRWCRDIARGLAAAHGEGVVHRDVKPANILVGADGVKLVDFGLAHESGRLTMTQTGTFRGTPYYASPEQVAARRIPIDTRTDVYSLGVTLYEVATGEVPFAGETREQVFQQILMKEPVAPRKRNDDISRDLETVILTAIEKDPDRRYPSAAAFADDLDCLLQMRPVKARPVGMAMRSWRWLRRNPYRGVAASLLMLLLVGLPAAVMIVQRAANEAMAGKLEKIERLSDSRDARMLLRGPGALWPANESRLADLDAWLQAADELSGRRAQHEANLEDWKRQAPDGTLAWQIGVVEGLLKDLDAAASVHDLMRKRRDFARDVRELTVTGPSAIDAWGSAQAAIRQSDGPYGSLDLAPQEGLLPLGPDPKSGLWEFWHPLSGDRPARDAATGQWQLTEQTGMVFVLIPGGTVDIGARRPDDQHPVGAANVDPLARLIEGPVHAVTLAPFFLSKYEWSIGQFERMFGETAVRGEPTDLPRALVPISHMVPNQADVFAERLLLTLPTEAQWEYAYRAGTTTPWPFGAEVKDLQGFANVADGARSRAFGGSESRYDLELEDGYVGAAPIGSFAPNAFGLHNMGGNYVEICRDRFADYGDCTISAGDGGHIPRERQTTRIARGGNYADRGVRARASFRNRVRPNVGNPVVGVRLARSIE